MTDSAVSSSAATSFLKLPAVSLTNENGVSIRPTASTGTRNAFPAAMAIQAPSAKQSIEVKHTSGNLSVRPEAAKTACASVISRRRNPAFFRLVVSLISARILPGAAVKRAKRLSLSSRGETCSTIKSPAIMPMQAISWIIVIHLPPFLERIAPTLQAASRFR